jgi:aspartoacylase
MKILLLGSQHGNELLGEYLYTYIRKNRPDLLPHVEYKVANLRAKKQGIRYLESDLNRSYSGKNKTYEERRAQRILHILREKDYAIVLDLHTTACVQPPCFIVANVEANGRFLRASSITRIVKMSHEIVKSSLIGNHSASVSIEINKDDASSEQILEQLCDDISRFLQNKSTGESKQIFEVTNLLRKTEISPEEAAKLVNFTLSNHGFYPVLVGENSYKAQTEYLGFKGSLLAVNKV